MGAPFLSLDGRGLRACPELVEGVRVIPPAPSSGESRIPERRGNDGADGLRLWKLPTTPPWLSRGVGGGCG